MKRIIAILICLLLFTSMAGCMGLTDQSEENSNTDTDTITQTIDSEYQMYVSQVVECYRSIYEEAVDQNTIGTLETEENIISCLENAQYTAIDINNQIDMVHADQVMDFIEKAENNESTEVKIICLTDSAGFILYDLQTKDGVVTVTRGGVSWNNKTPEISASRTYTTYSWSYSEEGYLFIEEYHMQGYDGASGHTAFRVQPLDETCRELNREYIMPIGYERNNMFLIDWNENDYADLNFYDLFDIEYPILYNRYFPYVADANQEIGNIYHIPQYEFEQVIMSHFQIDSATLQSKTDYIASDQSYEYRPRGFVNGESSSYPYPEVVGYTENDDGTLTLTVQAVFPDANIAKAFVHEVVVRPLSDGGFQYVSNHVIPSDENVDFSWHEDRYTKEEWEEIYGES